MCTLIYQQYKTNGSRCTLPLLHREGSCEALVQHIGGDTVKSRQLEMIYLSFMTFAKHTSTHKRQLQKQARFTPIVRTSKHFITTFPNHVICNHVKLPS